MNEALKVDPNNCETLQVMASFKISQQKPDEALHYLTRSYETWKSLIEKANQADIGEDNEEREGKLFANRSDVNCGKLLPELPHGSFVCRHAVF